MTMLARSERYAVARAYRRSVCLTLCFPCYETLQSFYTKYSDIRAGSTLFIRWKSFFKNIDFCDGRGEVNDYSTTQYMETTETKRAVKRCIGALYYKYCTKLTI